eukprot:6492504-Amphidinium_carterae.2
MLSVINFFSSVSSFVDRCGTPVSIVASKSFFEFSILLSVEMVGSVEEELLSVLAVVIPESPVRVVTLRRRSLSVCCSRSSLRIVL